MKTIKLFKNQKPKTRIGTNNETDKNGYPIFYAGKDIKGGPSKKGGSIKWNKTPIRLEN